MANTTFTGPVISLNGFSGTVLTVASATIDNLVCTSLTIGSTKLTNGSVSGTVATQAGRIPVLVGSTTLYIALYSSLTP